jgi:recA bacterial DNA recombination protein
MPFFGMASKIDDSPPGSSLSRSARLSAASIVDLRNLLTERFPHSLSPPTIRLATGISALDQATDGGLPKGAITELSSAPSSAGTASLIHALLRGAYRDRYFLALIDGRDSFDPQPLGNICLRNLLWVRCAQAIEAVKATDLLLRDGNFPLVILDLVLNIAPELRKIPQSSWYRLQRLVEPAPTVFLILTRRSMVSSAQLKLSLENSWTLADLERTAALSQCKIRVQRMQGGRQTTDLQIASAG